MLTMEHVTVAYGSDPVVQDVSCALHPGQWLMLMGPNGAGKSTLIEAIAQGVSYTGAIRLEGKDIRTVRPVQLAQKIGVLSQKNPVSYGYTVEEVVGLGRYAHAAGFLAPREDDNAHVQRALAQTGLTALRHANILTLSGGELQRTFLAQVLAQDPQILILDEPANHLDLLYQKQVFSLIDSWRSQPGRAVLSVVHDISLARRYGSHALLLHKGCVQAQGEMEAVCTPETLSRAYDMDVHGWMQSLLAQWQ